jgi:hypothetical protein
MLKAGANFIAREYNKITERQRRDMFEDYPDLLTRRQAQELLHMGKNRILGHIQSGRLRAMILDGRYLIKKEDVVDFINRLPYR